MWFCAGMGSKCLISKLLNLYPNSIFIDIGSGIDFLCKKSNTRGSNLDYATIRNYFLPMLPNGWDDFYKILQFQKSFFANLRFELDLDFNDQINPMLAHFLMYN